MSKIILMRGIQGSGKSTWAKNWVAEDPNHRVRWNQDDLRNMFGVYWVPNREKLPVLNVLKRTFIYQYMKAGYDIVLDDMNLNPKTVTQITDIIEEFNKELNVNYTWEFMNCFTSVEECIRRDSMRSNPIGEKVIKDTWKRYRNVILSIQSKEFINKIKDKDPAKDNVILFDLDGTIAYNTSGRPFYGEGCSEGIKTDYADSRMLDLIQIYRRSGIKIGFLTGREGTPEIRKATQNWIAEHIGDKYEFLLMRPVGVYKSGPECKEMLYKSAIEPKYNVIAVYEDSKKVCDMWRELGILCLQPNEGNC